jgi:anti-anti-sigma regulatory factor
MAASTQPLVAPQGDVHPLGETACVVTTGPWFSAVTSAVFAEAVHDAHLAGAREFLLDLTAVRAVDAAGTAALAALSEELDDLGCEIAIASTHPGLVSWLDSSPLECGVPVHDTVAEGLADLLRRPV